MEAKAAILALTRMPYQRSWADELQYIQLKREVAGTSRIEGAEFTEKELEARIATDARAVGDTVPMPGGCGRGYLSLDRTVIWRPTNKCNADP